MADIIFDIYQWQRDLDELVDAIVQTGDQEIAIQALQSYDHARKRMDKIQAVPPARREMTYPEAQTNLDRIVDRMANAIKEDALNLLLGNNG